MKGLFRSLQYLAIVTAVIADEYPQGTLQCHSYLTQPKKKLICPEARNNYCVKEVSSLTKDICGATQYFGDLYVDNLCVFKKCAETCTAGTFTFQFQGKTYSRTRYCCKEDLCNSGMSISSGKMMFALAAILIAMIAMLS